MEIRAATNRTRKLDPVTVIIVPYDPEWPGLFEQERRLLAEVFRGTATRIEHVGSTAVPGLGAKPILDITVGVAALSQVESRLSDLRALEYDYVPEHEVEFPERRYFHKPITGTPTHHLHCVVEASPFWLNQLAFRDYLRKHPLDSAAYFELKRELAARHRLDRHAYTRAKTAFIHAVLAKTARAHP